MRATKGGQIGMNGERYEGGQFLPNTELTKMARATRSSSRKVQVGHREWAVAPEGQKSLFAQFATFINWQTGEINATACAYYRRAVEQVADMKARWEAGERWVQA